MLCIRSRKLIEFLWEYGCIPCYETSVGAYYVITNDLYMLLDRYYIRYYCIPNVKERYNGDL